MADNSTWSIVFVPYTNYGGAVVKLQSEGVITMKPEQLNMLMFGPVGNWVGVATAVNGVAQAAADFERINVNNAILPNDGNIPDVLTAGAFLALDTTAANNGIGGAVGAAAGVANSRVAAAAAATAANADGFANDAAPAALANNAYANAYLSALFTAINNAAPATRPAQMIQAFFGALERRVWQINQAGVRAIPNGGVGAVNVQKTAFRDALAIAPSFAYVLLLKYPENNKPGKHSEVYYKKYEQKVYAVINGTTVGANIAAGDNSMMNGIYNAFSRINIPTAAMIRGGSGHSSILAQYMPQLGRKQSKKHRRKYAKGRTARR